MNRNIAYQLHPFTNLREHEAQGPLVITGGKGIHVRDDAGREYIESVAGLWCTSLGFGEERLIEAAARQMRRLSYYHQFGSTTTDVAVDLAERLIAILPVPMSKIFFASSGSEATDGAVKLVWYYQNALGRPRKKKIIARQRAYHGTTVVGASLTGLGSLHGDFDLPIPQVRHVECPYYYREARAGETEEDYATRLAESLERQILQEDPETVAAFIAEPVMGVGGVLVPPRTYFEKIQRVLRNYDVLMIADEVICGFGRTGRMFGTETFGLQPDIIVMAKALSSAYFPISATAISEPLYQVLLAQSDKLGVFAHGFTNSGHPAACAVALEALRIYEERDIVGHVGRVGTRLLDGLRRLASHPLVGDVRGVGMIAGVELVRDKATKAPHEPAGTAGRIFVSHARENGFLSRALADTIAVSPPLVITADEVDDLLQRFVCTLDATAKSLG